jgi:PAS domain S-box-containing protein
MQKRAGMQRDDHSGSGRYEDTLTPEHGARDADATGEPSTTVWADAGGADSREDRERQAAWRRGEEFEQRDEDSPMEQGAHGGRSGARVAERAFTTLADGVRDYAIFLMDTDGVITRWGEGARLIKWWTREQAEGGHLRFLYPAGGSEDGTAEAHLAEAAETGEYTGEGHRMRSDCSTFWAGVTLTALRDETGELLGFVKLTRDLTAQRASDAVRQAALTAAEEANQYKSQFLATVSHEVRTPLTSVMAYTDLLKMEVAGPLTEAQHRYLDTMRSSSQHLLGLIDDILDLSRSEAGHLSVNRRSFSVGTAVAQALLVVDLQARRRRVELVDAVSGAAGGLRCWGDEERLRQILLNLIGNALKFTQSGGRVMVSAGMAADPPADAELNPEAGPWVYIRVEDTGQGIPSDRQEAIFEPFVQIDMSSTRQHGGTGLGLAISRRLARLMGGDVTVRSDAGFGATFFVWLSAAPMGGEPQEEIGPVPSPSSVGMLQAVRDAVLTELERILHAYVARLRSDAGIPSARALPERELEDHLASFLADVAQTFGALELSAGSDSEALRDGTAIQRTIAERHGAQRARLGWAEAELRRELEILREEIAAAVRRRVSMPREHEIDEGLDVLNTFLQRAEVVALTSFRRSSTAADGTA